MPANVPGFVLQLLESAVALPSCKTLRPLYKVVRGAGSGMLEILPPRMLLQLQSQLIKLLRNLDDHMASLLCLVICSTLCSNSSSVRCLASDSEHALSSQDDQTRSEPSTPQETLDVYHPVRQFFNAKKGFKTIEFVVLRAILSCSSRSDMHFAQAVESLELAKDILKSIDTLQKSQWIEKNSVKVRKLHEKIRCVDNDSGIRLAAIEVVAALTGIVSVPNDLIVIAEGLLQRASGYQKIDNIVINFAGRFSVTFIVSQLTKAFRIVVEDTQVTPDALVELEVLISFMRELANAVKTSALTRQVLLSALSSEELRYLLDRFVCVTTASPINGPKHERNGVCSVQKEASRSRLRREICYALLKAAFYASSDKVKIEPLLATALLDKITSPSTSGIHCGIVALSRKAELPSLFLCEDQDQNSVSRDSHNWKSLLKDDLDRAASGSYDIIIQRVNAVCKDLEDRCSDLESPLSEERKRVNTLQRDLEHCTISCSTMEKESQERILIMDGLKDDNSQLVDEVKVVKHRIQDVSAQLGEARQTLSKISQEATHAANFSREILQQQELAHMAAIAAKDELIEQQAAQVTSFDDDKRRMSGEVSNVRDKLKAAEDMLSQTSSILKQRDAKIEELETCISVQEERLACQIQIADQNSAQILNLTREDAKSRLEMTRLQVDAEMQLQTLRLAVLDEQRKHDVDCGTKDAELSHQKHHYERLLTVLEAEAAKTKENTARLSHEHTDRVTKLTRTITELGKERDIRSKEFAEVQDLSRKLMALMGSKSPKAPKIDRSFHKNASRKFATQESLDSEYAGAIPQRSFESSISSKGGSTPKRTKLGSSFKTLSAQTATNSEGEVTSNSFQTRTQTKRVPLRDCRPNKQNLTPLVPSCASDKTSAARADDVGGKSTVAEDSAMMSQSMHEFSFDNSNMFISTDYQQRAVDNADDIKRIHDKTTADL